MKKASSERVLTPNYGIFVVLLVVSKLLYLRHLIQNVAQNVRKNIAKNVLKEAIK